jgi:hypothetical protein
MICRHKWQDFSVKGRASLFVCPKCNAVTRFRPFHVAENTLALSITLGIAAAFLLLAWIIP